jgi:hypothetical protein
MATTTTKRKGRKPTGNALTSNIVVRCRQEQKEAFDAFFGPEWLRKQIDRKLKKDGA